MRIFSRIQSKEEKSKPVLVAILWSSAFLHRTSIPPPRAHPATPLQRTVYWLIHDSTSASIHGRHTHTAAMKKNDVIAIIVIILFLVLAGVAFGIATLVHQFRRQTDGSHSGSSGSSSSSED
ncbi:unnamed protein product [Clonostachys chloroleuca]|uniref:Uncharacterized protein n=1 Tax=Clonostachys chloroleuca TaxID=1926264 RepID=A0AA35MIW1_9HYPO|nr:unnamed protein product [Clonostachys chloroleuca]